LIILCSISRAGFEKAIEKNDKMSEIVGNSISDSMRRGRKREDDV